MKSFIICALVAMATTNAYKITGNHDNAVLKTFPTSTGDIYTGLKDYIELDQENSSSGIHGNYQNMSQSLNGESIDAIVEIAVVCDKEWGDMFQHNRQQILEYWTVFFWDVNAQFQTLPSVNITFRVTSVTVINSFEDQPFIEDSRDENGGASFGSVVWRFGDWMSEQYEAGKVANYDIAVLATNTLMKEGGIAGMAYLSTACSKNRGVGLFRDGGHLGTLTASHEIAHILGANHDHDVSWCPETGFIMEADERDKRFFFSWCSDVQISEYAKSDRGSCLRTINEGGNPVIGQDFEGALPPSVEDQCKKNIRDPNAVVPDAELGKCRDVLCWASPENGGYGIRMGLVENSKCIHGLYGDEGRCFRARCRPLSAQLINVNSNECLLSGGGRFLGIDNATAVVEACPQHQTPLNSIAKIGMNEGQYLMMAYASPDATDIGDKCFVYEEDEVLQLRFVNCSVGESGWPKGWTLRDVGNEQFMLLHTFTKKCLKQTGNGVTMTENCDQNDKSMIWRFRN